MSIFGGMAGGVVGGATVKLFLDDTQFKAGLAEAEGQTKAAGGTMGKFGGAAQAGFAIAAGAVVAFGAKSFDVYMKQQDALAQLQGSLSRMPQTAGETTQAFEDQAKALEHLTGFTDTDIISADNLLTRFKLTGDQIRQAIPIVLDYARATGTAVPAAAQNIGKALLGNTRALKTVGIDFKATGNTAKDFSTILGALQGKIGGVSAEFATTLAGKIEIAKTRVHDFAEEVGGFAASAILAFTGDLGGAAKMWITFGDSTKGAAKAFGDVLKAGIEANKTLTDIVAGPAEQGMKDIAAAANKLATAEQNAADHARNLYLAQLSLAGGLVGLAADEASATKSKNDLAAAQSTVTKLTADGKKGTDAYAQAVRDRNAAELTSIQSQLSLTNDAQQLFAEFKKGNVTLTEADARLRSQAQAAGLSAGQTQSLVSQVNALYAAGKKIPANVSTTFTANGLSSNLAQIAQYNQYLAGLNGKQVFITVHTQYISTGSAPHGGIQ